MSQLFLLQFESLISTLIMALIMLFTRPLMRRRFRKYEAGRWMIFAAMLLFAIQYAIQMIFGFREKSDSIGAVINMLFYTPIVCLLSYANVYLVGSRHMRRKYLIASIVAIALQLIIFGIGWLMYGSLEMPHAMRAMGGVFFASLIYLVVFPHRDARHLMRRLQDNTGSDLVTYYVYMGASLILIFVFAVVCSIAIYSTEALFYVGPMYLAALLFYICSFVALGFHISSFSELLESQQDEEDEKDDSDTEQLNDRRIADIESRLKQWRKEGGYSDSDLNLASLARRLHISQNDMSRYLSEKKGMTFRVWLSEIRIEEAKYLLLSHEEYSIEAIALECGFSSRSWLQQKFKAATGMTPSEWRDAQKTLHR